MVNHPNRSGGMKVRVLFYDVATGNLVDEVATTLVRFVEDNPNSPPQYVIRQEIREIGAYITQRGNLRTEVVKA